MKTLVIGYGNRLRGDDGAGPAVAERLDRRVFDGVTVRAADQLQIEWAAEWAQYDRVWLIDAAIAGAAVSLEQVRPADRGAGDGGAHHLHPGVLLSLARVLFGGEPVVYRWRIRGRSFEFGDELTSEAEASVAAVTEQIAQWFADGGARRGAEVPWIDRITSV